jgi:hypothetical protein
VYIVLLTFKALSNNTISNFTLLGSENKGFAVKFMDSTPDMDLYFPGGVKLGIRSC